MILSKVWSGELTKGSFSKTSKAAPAIILLLKALYKSFSFINPPLAAFIKYDVFFINLIFLLSIIFFVLFIMGRCKDTKSDNFNTSSKEDFSASNDSMRSILK